MSNNLIYGLVDPRSGQNPETQEDNVGAKIPFKKRWKRVGSECWFIADNRKWYRCRIEAKVNSKGETVSNSSCFTMVLSSITGQDSTRSVEWPYGAELAVKFYKDSQQAIRVRSPDEVPPS